MKNEWLLRRSAGRGEIYMRDTDTANQPLTVRGYGHIKQGQGGSPGKLNKLSSNNVTEEPSRGEDRRVDNSKI